MSKTSVSDNADHFVFIPDYITVRDKSYSVKDLMMSARTEYAHFRRSRDEWKTIGGHIAKSRPRDLMSEVCTPCEEHEYKESKSNEKKYRKWYDLITLSFKEFMAENPGFKAQQVPPQRWLAKQRALTDANFSCWLHKNGLA